MRMALARDERLLVAVAGWEKAIVLQSTRTAIVKIFFILYNKNL